MEILVKTLAKIFFKIFYRVEITGLENVPEKGGVLICSNHIGELDMFLVGYKLKRLIHYMAKAELFSNPVSAYFFKGIGAFPVKRGAGDVGAVKAVIKLLRQGNIVGILPEGTRTRGKDLKDIKVKPGAALFALTTGAPIVPAAVGGSYKLFSKVKVVFGKPFYLEADKDKKPSTEELTEMSRDIMNRVYSLLEEK